MPAVLRGEMGGRPVAVLEVLRGVVVQPEAQQGQAVWPAVELQEGRQREAERPGVHPLPRYRSFPATTRRWRGMRQLVQLVPPPAPPRKVVGLQVGPRLPKQDSRQRRRSHDP